MIDLTLAKYDCGYACGTELAAAPEPCAMCEVRAEVERLRAAASLVATDLECWADNRMDLSPATSRHVAAYLRKAIDGATGVPR